MATLFEVSPRLVKASTPRVATAKVTASQSVAAWYAECIALSESGMFTTHVTVTPELAAIMLTNNPENRHFKPMKMRQLMADMRSGRWVSNGENVIVARTGELNDGQHRLVSIVETGMGQELPITFGPERRSRLTVDQGTTKGSGCYLTMHGVPNALTLSGITRQIIAFERTGGKSVGLNGDLSPGQIFDRAIDDVRLHVAASFAHSNAARMRPYLKSSVTGMAHFLLCGIDKRDGVTFMSALLGENIQSGDAVFSAREKLINMKHKTVVDQVEIVFRAWNAFREGRKMRTINVLGRLPELV